MLLMVTLSGCIAGASRLAFHGESDTGEYCWRGLQGGRGMIGQASLHALVFGEDAKQQRRRRKRHEASAAAAAVAAAVAAAAEL